MSILTPAQKLIFDQVIKSDFLRSNFYFTGGTALSEFYLKHRHSQDLDFFSDKKFETDQINIEVGKWAKKLGFTFNFQFREVVLIFILKFKDKTELKVDFGYYPYKRVEKGMKHKGFVIDSLLDIAINKFSAINHRLTGKDFTDLYFLLKKFTIWDLIEGARVKFKMETDPWILSSDLAFAAENIEGMPKMIKPLTVIRLKKFFKNLSIQLGKKYTG